MRTAVLTSGGVDSSIALYLTKKQGYNPTAFYIKIWLEESFSDCPWDEDLRYLKEVVRILDVPLKIVPLQKEYYDYIISYALKELKKGKTPNPDIWCNKLIKFGIFNEKYGKNFDYIATGHYAKKVEEDGNLYLKIAKDKSKDQSYFLSLTTKEQLKKALFPVGNFIKTDVRKLAEELRLPNYSRPDSQGLCFLGKIAFKDFLSKYIGEREGDIIDKNSLDIVGKHRGHWFYTIGQRQGIGIGGKGEAYYVSGKDPVKNIVYVARGKKNLKLYSSKVSLKNLNILAPELLKKDSTYLIKLRHPHEGVLGRVKEYKNSSLKLILDKPAFGITEGQYGVLYKGQIVVCCGEIIKQI